ncbi:hypothetical protein ACLOJK_008678 [Asimina triloba]
MRVVLRRMRKAVSALFLLFLVWNCFGELGSEAQQLPKREIEALEAIAQKLKKTDWNTSVNPCSRTSPWVTSLEGTYVNNVNCSCSSSVCNVISIELKGQNLTGVLPEEFANLTLLQQMTLLGNRISGRIPAEIGSISTLESLVIESNELSGPLPPELGNLGNLSRFFACSNNLTGEIPDTFRNLRNLEDFRIDGNPISGAIPDFIGSWTRLGRLDMQGTSMIGQIPSSIGLLVNLTDLRITDLNVSSMPFPPLQTLVKMKSLTLRNCSISDVIPPYIGNMKQLKLLDLSFNNLRGEIPQSIQELDDQSLDYLIASCLRKNYPCPQKATNYELFINCGGEAMTIGEHEYEADTNQNGRSAFSSSSNGRWAYSSTGLFVGDDNARFLATKTSESAGDLYSTARTAPISLKYYGLCLQNGNYTVGLHFSEIIFTNDQSYISVGKRIFDVSINGEPKLKDYNIVEDAGSAGIPKVRNFTVLVTNHTLEIHFYWAGKGTTSIPVRGFYGPLISAITVTPNFKPDMGEGDSGLSAGAIAGIVVGCCIFVGLILIVLWMKGCFGGKDPMDKELRGLELQTGYFPLRQIKTATNNFDPANKIGEGGFGPVHRGTLPDGSVIAVKQLSAKSKQGNREFVNEIGMISALQHPNLVKLFGCCIEGNQLFLIYEYMENNSLARALFGREDQRLKLDWPTRQKICLGIARGLAYLHEESRLKIVHRDIKGTNVLLDKDLNAKISDFGLAKLDEEENTHISTRIAGTMWVLAPPECMLFEVRVNQGKYKQLREAILHSIVNYIGYMAPEYAMRGYLTDKADVYSFGVVLLEIVSGKSNTNYRPKEEFVYLLDWAYVLQEKGSLLELVDPVLGSNYSKDEALRMLNLALVCTNPSPTLRPIMSKVVSMLEGHTMIRIPTMKSTSSMEDMRFKAFERLSQDSQSHSISMEGPWMDSSTSIPSKEGETTTAPSSTRPWMDSSTSFPSKEGETTAAPSSTRQLLPDAVDISKD